VWFPNICTEAVVKKTGRRVKIREIFNDHVVYVEAEPRQRVSYWLKDLDLIWPDTIPGDQRCNSTVFAHLVKSTGTEGR
jgi:hypothetical protein